MKFKILIQFLFITPFLSAQTFTQFTQSTPLEAVWYSSVAFSDVDGDGDEDLLITGQNNSQEGISKLYINDGAGNFSELMGNSFDGVELGSVAFSDLDGDGDEDLLITGQNNSDERISKLYINDGAGNFSELMGTPFDGVMDSSVAFSDVDGDGDKDVLITGLNNSAKIISKLYTNDGAGNFSEMTGSSFEGAWAGSLAFSDVDGDDDEDVLITGQNNSGALTSKLYTNDGAGNFSEVMDSPFDAVGLSSVAFSDIDGDGDKDVLITGESTSFERISKLYTNNGIVSSTDNLSIKFNLDFRPYPNPTRLNDLYISYNSAENELVMLKVYDLNGRLLSQQKEFAVIGEKTFSVDIASLVQGTYLIELGNGKRRGVVKFIVQ